jgi:hypothetical protein
VFIDFGLVIGWLSRQHGFREIAWLQLSNSLSSLLYLSQREFTGVSIRAQAGLLIVLFPETSKFL